MTVSKVLGEAACPHQELRPSSASGDNDMCIILIGVANKDCRSQLKGCFGTLPIEILFGHDHA